MFPDLTRDDVFRLETARLWLRWPRLSDAQAIVRLAGEKSVAEMTGTIPHPYPPDAAEPFLFNTRKTNATGQGLILAITRKGHDGLIGVAGLRPQDGGDLELGYWIGLPYHGDGYATETARAIIEVGFLLTEAPAICATARVINPASRRVIEKCGFVHVGACLRVFPARGGALAVDRFELERQAWLIERQRRRQARHAGATAARRPAAHETRRQEAAILPNPMLAL